MNLPQHIAIIMDGNGRWAKKRLLPRIAGHQQGVESVRAVITSCVKKKIPYLTLYTFSSENWQRPQSEVNFLISLFSKLLKNEIKTLSENNVCLKVIGDKSRFTEELNTAILEAETFTKDHTGLQLNIAFNYGGRWDILQATRELGKQIALGNISPNEISENDFRQYLSLSDCPDPDFLIRTSGEYRISNFLLWQFAYTELYFTESYWPDFRESQFEEALKAFANRNRRFGKIDEQEESKNNLRQMFGLVEKIHA
jgi:undecaprenyl diphosphate synthase